MTEKDYRELLREGMDALRSGRTDIALQSLEKAHEQVDSPEIQSHLAFCIAKERRDYQRAESLCESAISEDPGSSAHYLNLGRILLLAGRKRDAIRVFRDGLLHENNPVINDELKKLGTRRYPIISSLPREHGVNRILGKLLYRFRSKAR